MLACAVMVGGAPAEPACVYAVQACAPDAASLCVLASVIAARSLQRQAAVLDATGSARQRSRSSGEAD